MKKAILTLILVFVAATAFAGDGKSCDMSKSGKAVELTGTVVLNGDKAIFRVADSNDQYSICHKSKASLEKLSKAGKAVRVSGKLVSCGEGEGTELMIESAKSI